jgi:KUP system potassium uptake protein
VTVVSLEIPFVPPGERISVRLLSPGCWAVAVRFGFNDNVDVPAALALLERQGIVLDPMRTSYFLSRSTVVPMLGGGMAPWREKLYANMHRNASSAADFLNLPPNRVIELGTKVQI